METKRFRDLCERFSPFAWLAADLLPHAVTAEHDAAHDIAHLSRVWSLSSKIALAEGGEMEILAAAVLLHDCVAIPKSSPHRTQASRLAGAEAHRLLEARGWGPSRISRVVHAIEAHSFSAGIEPLTLEARILQDADRLDAIGAIGAARSLMVGGRLDRPLYDVLDPTAEHRASDDTAWTLDHFPTKLLRLRGSFRTKEGARIADIRHDRIARIYAELVEEIG